MAYTIAGIEIAGPALYMYHDWLIGYNVLNGASLKPRESTKEMVDEFLRVSKGGSSWDWKAERVKQIKAMQP